MKRVLLVLSLVLFNLLHAQSNKEIDSLKRVLINLETDSLKTVTYQKISKKYVPISFDSAYAYGHKALQLAKILGNDKLITTSYTKIGLAFDYQSKIDSTLF